MDNNQDQKKKLLEDFRYEVNMLTHSFNYIKEKNENEKSYEKSLLTEDFALHFRNLYEFFYKNKKRDDDARASDFFLDSKTSESLKKYYKRVCKEINHLTYSRYNNNEPEKSWPTGEILKSFLPMITIFIEHLPCEYKNQELLDLNQRCSELLGETQNLEVKGYTSTSD